MTTDPLLEDFVYCAEHELLDNPLGRAIARNFQLGLVDELIVSTIRGRAAKHRRQELIRPTPPFDRWPVEGPLRLGRSVRGEPLGFSMPMASANWLTIAGSGGGKTWLACRSVLELAPQLRGMWLFDLAKSEFSRLTEPLRRQGIELHGIAARDLRFNILQTPDGVDRREWPGRVAQTLTDALGFAGPSSRLLHSVLHAEFANRANDPTVLELIDAVRSCEGGHTQTKQAIASALQPIADTLGNYRRGWSTCTLSGMALAIDCSSLADEVQDTLMLSLLVGEFTRRIAAGVSNASQADLLVSIDEGARLCRRRPGRSDSAVTRVMRMGRGVGMTTAVGVQDAHDLDPGIVANCGFLGLGRTGSHTDAVNLGRTLGLSTKQFAYYRKHSAPGVFVGRLLDGPTRQAVMFTVEAPPLGPASPPSGVPIGLAALPVETAELQTKSSPALDEAERRVLTALRDHPMQPSSSYPSLVGMGQRRFITIRDGLADRGLLRIHEVQRSARGRTSMLLEITEAGLALLEA